MSLLSWNEGDGPSFSHTRTHCSLKVKNVDKGETVKLYPSFILVHARDPSSGSLTNEHDSYGIAGFELSEYFEINKITIFGEQRPCHNHSPKTVRFLRVSNPDKNALLDEASTIRLGCDRDIPHSEDIEKRQFSMSASGELGRYGVFLWNKGWDWEYVDFSATATGWFITGRSNACEQESMKLRSAVFEILDQIGMIPDLIKIVLGYCDFARDVERTVFRTLSPIA